MGVEAYRLAVKFNEVDFNRVYERLLEYEAKLIEKCSNGDYELEIMTNNGYIEMLLKLIKNDIALKQMKNSELKGYIVLSIRFAIPNPSEIVDDIVELVSKLSNDFQLAYFGDAETKSPILIEDYSDLKLRVNDAKLGFEEFFSELPYPIRCRDVFPTFRRLNPDRVL